MERSAVTKSTTLIQALIATFAVASMAVTAVAERAAEPHKTYLRAAALYEDGMKAAGLGQHETAVSRLKAAQTLIQKLSQSQPGWQPALVAYRLQKIGNALQELDEAQGEAQVSGIPGQSPDPPKRQKPSGPGVGIETADRPLVGDAANGARQTDG